MIVKVFDKNEISDEKIKYAIIMAKYDGQWVFSRHKGRDTWEIPGGHREIGETPLECAKRELYEETGADVFTLKKIFDYGAGQNEIEAYGSVFYADITVIGKMPDFEMDELLFTTTLPDKLTYPEIQSEVYGHTQAWLNLMSSPDELWDIYDSERNLTGKLHKRGVPMNSGEYHLSVHVIVKRNDGKLLVTKRSPNKGFGNLWEITGGSAVHGDDSLTAAMREVKEETGLALEAKKGRIIWQRRYTDAFVDVWLFEHEFDIDDVVLLEGETCDAMLVTKEELTELIKSEKFVPTMDFLQDIFDII